MKIICLGPLRVASPVSVSYTAPLSAIDQQVLSVLARSARCAPQNAEAAVREARAAGGPNEFSALLGRALELVQPVGSKPHPLARPSPAPAGKSFSGFILPDGTPIWGHVDPNAGEPTEVQDGIAAGKTHGVFLPGVSNKLLVFRRMCYRVEDVRLERSDEIALRIKHLVYRQEKALEKIQKEVAAFENFERLPSARRERIPESVRLFVWQRDSGHCVRCESSERLEFDHIIPIVEGGSSTERNVQLLCEKCNRTKGKTI